MIKVGDRFRTKRGQRRLYEVWEITECDDGSPGHWFCTFLSVRKDGTRFYNYSFVHIIIADDVAPLGMEVA